MFRTHFRVAFIFLLLLVLNLVYSDEIISVDLLFSKGKNLGG